LRFAAQDLSSDRLTSSLAVVTPLAIAVIALAARNFLNTSNNRRRAQANAP
jgi:hypothetical protein